MCLLIGTGSQVSDVAHGPFALCVCVCECVSIPASLSLLRVQIKQVHVQIKSTKMLLSEIISHDGMSKIGHIK